MKTYRVRVRPRDHATFYATVTTLRGALVPADSPLHGILMREQYPRAVRLHPHPQEEPSSATSCWDIPELQGWCTTLDTLSADLATATRRYEDARAKAQTAASFTREFTS